MIVKSLQKHLLAEKMFLREKLVAELFCWDQSACFAVCAEKESRQAAKLSLFARIAAISLRRK